MEIKLNEYQNVHSANVDNHIGLSVYRNESILNDTFLSGSIDEYEQYLKEKDESEIYRLNFVIKPVCSNALFNAVSEIVKDEGSDSCKFYGLNGGDVSDTSLKKYLDYKKVKKAKLTRTEAIRDTSFSHPQIGPIVYHCGYDIFNNHTLRAKEFVAVNKINGNFNADLASNFNTISDYIRYTNGNIVSDNVVGINMDRVYDTTYIRLYSYDTILDYATSINENLVERDGWFGFINPTSIELKNYGDFSLNKCMNNNKACEFIDMYPDRSLYSFVPKLNKSRDRVEPNWKLCITYPSRNILTHPLVSGTSSERVNGVNGLKCDLMTNFNNGEHFSSNDTILFRTNIKNTFNRDSLVVLSVIIGGAKIYEIPNVFTVMGVGDNTNTGQDYYFSLSYGELESYIDIITNGEAEIRVSKIENGHKCKYYLRVFKRIPNFKNTDVYADDIVSEDEIKNNCLNDFNSTLGKNAFENTIYNDGTVQYAINDDINLKGLRNNLGLKVHEIFLTIVKANDGYEKWYDEENPIYNDSGITFSHCFGKVTSGFDLPYFVDDYNVHKIHNVACSSEKMSYLHDMLGVTESPKNLEENEREITINGDGYLSDGEFFGDIVEFNEAQLIETVLEDVMFRFNTAQREYTGFNITSAGSNTTVNGEFANIQHDEITDDIYDMWIGNRYTSSFISEETYNQDIKYNFDGSINSYKAYPVNIFPEGYYYKAHYKIKLRELDDDVSRGEHRIINVLNVTSSKANTLTITTRGDYYWQLGDNVYLSNKKLTNEMYKCEVISVNGDNFDTITITVPDTVSVDNFWNYTVFKYNQLKPYYSHELSDGTGRYVWKDIKKEKDILVDSDIYNSMFLNGAHYYEKNINFFLKRQDPNCEYGLSYCEDYDIAQRAVSLTIMGNGYNYDDYVYNEEQDIDLC